VVGILKQILLLSFALLSLLSTCLCLEIPVTAQTVNNPYELVAATVGEPETVDPAWAYDGASKGLIFNVYETLIFYDGESVDEFVPMLATDWGISDDGLTYTFEIRGDVKFHNGEVLTTEDVEYSFERAMVQDRSGGPAWMFYEPLLDVWEANLSDPDWGAKMDNAVQCNTTHVWFNLAKPYAPFLKILSQPWSSIVNKQFCVEHKDWPGTWENWQDYHNPDVSPLDSPEPVMCGTGPYKLDYWEEGAEWSVVRNDDYWGGWPAEHPELEEARGYLERATTQFKHAGEWDTWKLMFLAGDLDVCYVPMPSGAPMMYVEDVWGEPGIRCIYPLPALSCSVFIFNFDISQENTFLGVEGGLPQGTFNETGIPPDFFTDAHVRRGFAYCMDYMELRYCMGYQQYGMFLAEARYPATPMIWGLPYRRPDEWYAENQYMLDLAKAEEEFRLAWGGELWDTGFKLPLAYSVSNPIGKTIAEMLEANVESLNLKFHVDPIGVDCFLTPAILTRELPAFYCGSLWLYGGWLTPSVDYPDADSLFRSFVHSEEGVAAFFQSYSNASVDALVEEGLHTMNETRRREIYYELQQIYIDECPSIVLHQKFGRHWERTWVQGWYYNPAYPGLYFYHLWKEDLPSEDLNSDGIVNIMDIARCAVAFGSYCNGSDVHSKWDSYSDLNQDTNVNILDIAAIAKKFGSQALPWQPP
jgi:peptide/nickel transport system substrate-binding protein